MAAEAGTKIPLVTLSSGHSMPVMGLGTFEHPFDPEKAKTAVLEAIKIGYRHFDTASLYGSEGALGEAIAEAVQLGLIESRNDVFITSKLWWNDNHPDLVLPAIRSSLRNLKMEYLDLYLIHWPVSVKPGPITFPIRREDIVPFYLKGVWEAMEECQRLGLTKSIGVSNFTTKKLEELLAFAKISPAVNQVEMNPSWRQQKLKEYCAQKGIIITAYSPLGGQSMSGRNLVLTSDVLTEIANAKGKSVAQISLRWLYEQGASIVVKSFKKERLMENIEIFNWELTDEERLKINTIPRQKMCTVEVMLSKEGSLTSVDLADIEVVEI
ncbi:NAD(P)-linked oxidoreductase superfamily protein [Rhynchospora pubera]|uniref:NAD(P)-linked oxidoreductase superfamily protein n=1 Tax=Rhynchospora pubera TaxID=906938 RepID=A0AAV8FUY0_9POAL|nr:NAD(P)-linked oxidoreductase superfamily protein [Rhynchospora pubera]KAJ4794102.1 NAD(P)-linked oxidoreductase superfamily protein [Rhynchospora pubera]